MHDAVEIRLRGIGRGNKGQRPAAGIDDAHGVFRAKSDLWRDARGGQRALNDVAFKQTEIIWNVVTWIAVKLYFCFLCMWDYSELSLRRHYRYGGYVERAGGI